MAPVPAVVVVAELAGRAAVAVVDILVLGFGFEWLLVFIKQCSLSTGDNFYLFDLVE